MPAERRTPSTTEINCDRLEADVSAAAIGLERLSTLMTLDANGDLDANAREHARSLMARLAEALPQLQDAHLAIEEAKRLRELPN